jgi:hypothetical protein
MISDRRRSQRHTINRTAKFQTDIGALPRECTIIDISETGARLFVADVELPIEFSLLIFGDTIHREECRIVWRLGGEVGVSFITQKLAEDRADLVERVRAEAQKVFQAS